MADVKHHCRRKESHGPGRTLLIEACKAVGIEVPSFCYYPNLSLQGACRMCLVKVEKMPKLQTACTTVIGEGMVVTTDSDEVHQARKGMVELLLGNHPLDCPVCDAGGECELQDMTFSYGAAESKYMEPKNHKDEQQWSPVVYFRSAALHSLLPLRAGVRRGHGCLGAGGAEPRRRLDHRTK
jgi:NADH-quinone oxidoreductase subunit G